MCGLKAREAPRRPVTKSDVVRHKLQTISTESALAGRLLRPYDSLIRCCGPPLLQQPTVQADTQEI